MHALTEGELHALRNLLQKKDGAEVPFISIRDARTLTDLGLASRSQEGWDITAAGIARLSVEGVELSSSGAASDATEILVELKIERPSSGMETQAKLSERWRYLRTLLINQLDAFETGALEMRSDSVDVSPAAMAQLRKDIAEFDALIAEDEARRPDPG